MRPSFPSDSDGKESACNAGGPGVIPGSGRSPREGNRYPLQYSCLENSMDRGAWQVTVHGVVKSQAWLSNYTFTALSWGFAVWEYIFQLPTLQKDDSEVVVCGLLESLFYFPSIFSLLCLVPGIISQIGSKHPTLWVWICSWWVKWKLLSHVLLFVTP